MNWTYNVGRHQELDVAQATGIKAMRLTHSGEDGWILYIPSEVNNNFHSVSSSFSFPDLLSNKAGQSC